MTPRKNENQRLASPEHRNFVFRHVLATCSKKGCRRSPCLLLPPAKASSPIRLEITQHLRIPLALLPIPETERDQYDQPTYPGKIPPNDTWSVKWKLIHDQSDKMVDDNMRHIEEERDLPNHWEPAQRAAGQDVWSGIGRCQDECGDPKIEGKVAQTGWCFAHYQDMGWCTANGTK